MTPRAARFASAAALGAALALAAFLRLDGLGVPSFWLDEILHQQLMEKYAALPWWRWLGRLHEEHAGLYYLTQLATRLFGTSEAAARSAAALLGVATIPFAWLVARGTLGGRLAATAAAILLAVSPLHVYFSREARSYALLTFLTAALTLVLLRGRSVIAIFVVLLALLYTSAVSATIVLSAFVVCMLCALFAPSARAPSPRNTYLVTAALCIFTLALFRVVYTSGPVENANWPGFPELNAQFVATLLRTFTVSALGREVAGRAAIAVFLFAAIGAIALVRKSRRDAIVVVGMTLLPLVISLAALKTLDHFFAIRYVMASVFGFCVLAGIGVAALSARAGKAAAPVAVAIAILLASQAWPSARYEAFQKANWRGVAATIMRHLKPGDIVLAAESWSEVSLRHYLGQHANPPQLSGVVDVEVANVIRHGKPGTWLVSGGYEDSPMRRWLCDFPMIAATPLENVRLHYASPASDFLRERGGDAELRAFAGALGPRGLTLAMGHGYEQFLGDGWADIEGHGPDAFRWALGLRATLQVPRFGTRDRVVRIFALPFEHPTLAPQRVRASINGHPAGELALRHGWNEYAFRAPAASWRDGWNTIAFDFARAHPPAALDRQAHDARPLAASFRWVAVDDAGAPPSRMREFPVVTLPRSTAGTLLDEETVWRGSESGLDPATLRRDETLALLGRLGLDPETIWPRVARGELQLENLVETIAYGQDCIDGETFLRQAFAIILDRLPNEADRNDLNARMAKGATRVEIVRRIVRSGFFNERYVK